MKNYYGVMETHDGGTIEVRPLGCVRQSKIPEDTLERRLNARILRNWYRTESLARKALELRSGMLKRMGVLK